MMHLLKNHPFAVEAFFDCSTVLTFAVPKEQLSSMVPECLELDTFNDRWAFIAIAMVKTKNLRPKGFPKFLGRNFFLTGYRIFVRYVNEQGKKLRGLYIIKSETDQMQMKVLGNLFTHYNYTTTDIKHIQEEKTRQISSQQSDFHLSVENAHHVALPVDSPFKDWKEARRFAGPLPFTFTYNQEKSNVTIIQGVRQHWKPQPIKVSDWHFAYLNNLRLEGLVLASAFEVTNIPYHWKKGKTELWNK